MTALLVPVFWHDVFHRYMNLAPEAPAAFGLGPVVDMRITSEGLAAYVHVDTRRLRPVDEDETVEAVDDWD